MTMMYDERSFYYESQNQTDEEKHQKKTIRRSKHIPHCLRPAEVVDRRNTRERRRVEDVNRAFFLLQSILPLENKNDSANRLSKVRTLRKAVDYILALQKLLEESSTYPQS